jgi:phage shock protein PspC (stress-responsive transcriptional regulator)
MCGKSTRTGPAPPAGECAPRRLFRLNYDKQIAGVCAGIAKYMDVDVTLIRIVVASIAIFTGGLGITAYIFAWIIMPVDYGVPKVPQPAAPPAGAGTGEASAQPAA